MRNIRHNSVELRLDKRIGIMELSWIPGQVVVLSDAGTFADLMEDFWNGLMMIVDIVTL